MATLEVPEETARELRLLAAAWGVDDGEAVQRLIDTLASDGARATSIKKDAPERRLVPIEATYRGAHVTAEFDTRSHRVTITSGELEGESFEAPSPAAAAVVSSVAPEVTPNRNGWGFWSVTETGRDLQSIRYA